MLLSAISMVSGESHTLELPITIDEYVEGMIKRDRGMSIQEAFPTLSAPLREFIKTGTTPEEWNKMFAGIDDDEEEEEEEL